MQPILDQIISQLTRLTNKVDAMNEQVAKLNERTEEMRSDFRELKCIPVIQAETKTRLDMADKEIQSLRSKHWTIIALVIGAIITASGNVIVTLITK